MRGKLEQLTRAQPAWGGRAAKERLCPRSLQALPKLVPKLQHPWEEMGNKLRDILSM